MQSTCAVYRTYSLVGKRWTILILLEMHKGRSGKRRFSELRSALPGITSKMLSMRLKELQRSGILERHVDSQSFPLKCTYSLTKSGRGLLSVIAEMKKWALEWTPASSACRETRCRHCTL